VRAEYRSKRIDELVADITEKNTDDWFVNHQSLWADKVERSATSRASGSFSRPGREKPSIGAWHILINWNSR